jgi:hypothetical protein
LAVLIGAPTIGVIGAMVPSAPASASPACTGTVAGIAVFGGSGQVAKVGTAYSSPLEAEVVDTGGCPIADYPVDFIAPASGASGYFPGSTITVTVATGSNGIASASQLTANNITGSFEVEASADDGNYTTDFQLTNTTVGAVSSVTVSSGGGQSALIGDAFAQPLQVNVLDNYGDPVAGGTVTFEVVTDAGAGATFNGGGTTATAVTNESGVAVSPTLTAGDTPGAFTVTATVTGTSATATFSLTDLAGAANAIAAGVGSSQSTEMGADFAVPLAVTVTDADGNPVPGTAVTFSAPASGATGVFADAGTSAVVLTNADGVATAPDFSADGRSGGYVVTARVAGVATPATFALVNEPRSGASAPGPDGSYWLVTSTGQVSSSGGAHNYGSAPAKDLSSPVVAMAALPSGDGYWLVTSKGVVYPFGTAVNYGSPTKLHLAKPIVGIAATPDGKGYWLVASDGGIFNYGDAKDYGSPATRHLAKPIVGIAATPDGKGYWLVASDGGIFNYGDAKYYGSPATRHLAKPIVGIAATPDGKGYWALAASGVVYGYGDAISFGSGASLSPQPVKALVRTGDGAGYWIVSANGTAAGFGDAGAQGSPTSSAKAVVSGAA